MDRGQLLQAIIIWISFLIGYFIGQGKLVEVKQKVKEEIKKRTDSLPVGPIYSPTQQQLEERANPSISAGKKEFSKLIKERILK